MHQEIKIGNQFNNAEEIMQKLTGNRFGEKLNKFNSCYDDKRRIYQHNI